MKKLYFLLISILLTQFAFAQPANDDCANAESITVTTTSTSVSFDINTAVLNNEVGCDGTTAEDYADVWYSFTMPVNGNLYVDGSLSWNNFALYDSCGGTEIQCGSDDEFISNLTSGTNYILRVFRTSATAGYTNYQSFSIIAFENVTNDDCASAENITVSTTESTVNFEVGGATINNEVGCNGTTTADYADIWYDFTMPVNGNLYVSGLISWNNFALFDACAGTEIQCGSTNQLFTNLTSGTNYKLRVFRTLTNTTQSNYKSFTIQAFEEVANDDCASAETITVSTTSSTVNFEVGGATINNEVGCTGTTDDYTDIWYDFNMPVNGNLYINGLISWNNFALYDACAGTEIQCGSTNQLFTNLTSGTNYKLRVFRTLANTTQSNYKSFTIQAFEEVANDDCASAETITVSTSESTINFEIGGATINSEVGCTGTANDYADIWYDFTMPVNGNLYVNGIISWNNFALYDACAGTEIQCGSTNQLFTNLSSGTNYKLRVFRTQSLMTNSSYKSFTIQAFEIINNDDCVDSETISVSSTATTVNFGIAGATTNNEVGCAGTTAEDYADIWYDFTIPEDGDVTVDGTIVWNNFALYDACSGTELGCFSTDGTFTGLSSGINYKLRVFRTLATSTNASYKSFTIQSASTLGIADESLENNINIYPNPAREFINISIANNQSIDSVVCYNLLGKQVLNTTNVEQINVSQLEAGLYLLKINTKRGSVTKKIMIQ